MATLYYIYGDTVPGATKFNLYKANDAGQALSDDPTATMQLMKDFDFLGAVTSTGNVREKEHTLWAEGTSQNGCLFTPLRQITEHGVRYCFKVTGTVKASIGSGLSVDRIIEGVYDFPESMGVDTFSMLYVHIYATEKFVKKSDGYYLQCMLGESRGGDYELIQIHVLDDDPTITGLGFGRGTDKFLTLLAGEYGDDRRHTEYIPMTSLPGNLWELPGGGGAVCVGKFDFSEDDYDYIKMAFYNKNLKYVGGADSEWLAAYTASDEVNSFFVKKSEGVYFTAEGVYDVGKKVTGTSTYTEENYPQYVVFSSRERNSSDKDHVCLNSCYFPLFAMQESIFDDGANYFVVRADSDSNAYQESPDSNMVTYNHVKQS